MKKAQIQLPDALYGEIKRIAADHEWSLAETCRRGLEYIVRVYSNAGAGTKKWKLPGPFSMGKADPFADPDWRVKCNMRPTEELLRKPPRRKRNR